MFNSRAIKEKIGDILSEDRFRSVELSIAFRRIHCFKCDLTAIYRYRVKQVRRTSELQPVQDDEGSVESSENPPLEEIIRWSEIPRFAEIPETVKCKRCGEVLGVYTECIF